MPAWVDPLAGEHDHEYCRSGSPDRRLRRRCCRILKTEQLMPAAERLLKLFSKTSSRYFIRWRGVWNTVADRRQRLKVSINRLQVLVSHIFVPIPGHGGKNGTASSLMFSVPKGVDKHLLRPASDTCGLVRCQVHGIADPPGSYPGCEVSIGKSPIAVLPEEFRRNRRKLVTRGMPGKFPRHVGVRAIGCEVFRCMTVITSAG